MVLQKSILKRFVLLFLGYFLTTACVTDNPSGESYLSSFVEDLNPKLEEIPVPQKKNRWTEVRTKPKVENPLDELLSTLNKDLARSKIVTGYGKIRVVPQTLPLKIADLELKAFKEKTPEKQIEEQKVELRNSEKNSFLMDYSGRYCSAEDDKYWSGTALDSDGSVHPVTFKYLVGYKSTDVYTHTSPGYCTGDVCYAGYSYTNEVVRYNCYFHLESERFAWEKGFSMQLESRANNKSNIFDLSWDVVIEKTPTNRRLLE